MTLPEFFAQFEATTGQPPGSIRGQESLDSIKSWDSLAVLEFMLMADEKLGLQLEPAQIAACKQVTDLAVLCGIGS